MLQLRASTLAAAVVFFICQCRDAQGTSLDGDIKQVSVAPSVSPGQPTSDADAADWLESALWGPGGASRWRHHGLLTAHRLSLKSLQMLHLLPEEKTPAAPTQPQHQELEFLLPKPAPATSSEPVPKPAPATSAESVADDGSADDADDNGSDVDASDDDVGDDVLSAALRGVAVLKEEKKTKRRLARAFAKRRADEATRQAAAAEARTVALKDFSAGEVEASATLRALAASTSVTNKRIGSIKAARMERAFRRSGAAVNQINGLLKQVVEESELEKSRCETYMRAAKKESSDARDLSEEDEERLARIDSSLHASRAELKDISGQKSDLEEQLAAHKGRCAADLAGLRRELRTLKTDAGTTTNVMKGSPCKDKGKALLLECRYHGSHRSFIDSREKGLQQVMLQLSTTTARHSLQRTLRRAVAHKHHRHHDLMLLQRSHHRHWQHRGSRHHHRRQNKARARCRAKPMDCKVVENAIVLMMADVQDKQHTTNFELDRTNSQCNSVTADLEREIAHFEGRTQLLSVHLAQGMAENSQIDSEASLRLQEYQRITRGLTNVGKECEESIKAYENQVCTLKQSRVDIFTNNGVKITPGILIDCEVSPWSPAESCSKGCGGGVQQLIRTVVVPAGSKAMPCPALATKRACNVQSCPVDCKVTSWTAWSGCSAMCGGGTRSRNRRVLKMAQHGGEICPGENIISEACHTQPCVPDCVLAAWTPWTSCSRACNGGYQKRQRLVSEPAEGNALCPTEEQRSQYLRCKKQTCPVPKPMKTLKCNSAVDVIVVLDGSTSVSLKSFEKAKSFVSSLIKALNLGAGKGQAALISAGGPKAWKDFEKCKLKGSSKGALASCNVALTLSLSAKESAATSAVNSLGAPGGPAYLAGALSIANAQLELSRPDAVPVVLVVAHGRPLSQSRTTDEAARIREKARLMWVVVDGSDPETNPSTGSRTLSSQLATSWASRPYSDNVFHVESFGALASLPKVSELVSAVCPSVEGLTSR